MDKKKEDRTHVLAENNFRNIKDKQPEVAILPWGATEAHNYHLPYGTDNYETVGIAEEAGRLAMEQGVKCLVLPVVPFGVNTGQTDLPGTVNLYPSTQAIVLHDILESVSNWGIRKFLLLNGHGGNDFKQILREAGSSFPEMFLVTANWFQSVDKSKYFENDGDHADEMETSLMLHLRPELVLPLDRAGDGKHGTFSIQELNEKWAWSEREWSRVTKDTGIGDPRKATAEKGKAYFDEVCGKIAGLIVGMAGMDEEGLYR